MKRWTSAKQKRDIETILRSEFDAEVTGAISIDTNKASDRVVHDQIGCPMDGHTYYDVNVVAECDINNQPAEISMRVIADILESELITYQIIDSVIDF